MIVYFTSESMLAGIYGYDKSTAKIAAFLLNVKAISIFSIVPLVFFKGIMLALGKPLFPTISGFVEMAIRFIVAIKLTEMFGMWGIALTEPLTWSVTGIFLMIAYRYEFKKIEKESGLRC